MAEARPAPTLPAMGLLGAVFLAAATIGRFWIALTALLGLWVLLTIFVCRRSPTIIDPRGSGDGR